MKNKKSTEDIRPWGKYFIIDEGPSYKIKRIEVNSEQRLSYQFHNYRAETWIIIQGKGQVTIEGKKKDCIKGDTIEIPKGRKHRIKNNGDEKLIFIEVQTGTYFGEDDIVRVEDDYKRV